MNKTVKLLLIFLIFSTSLFAISNKYYKDKFELTKKLYLSAIMSNNRTKEINYLKKLIRYGDKLHINTRNYKRELYRIDKNTILRRPLKTKSILKWKPKSKYTIKSVLQNQNSITINFYKNINKSYIKFSKRKDRWSYYDEFDLKGSFKDASPMRLSISGIDKIKIFQYKKNTLRISLKNRTNLKTIYLVNKRQIIIKILNLRRSKKNKIVKKAKLIPKNIFYPSRKIIVIDAGHGGKDSGAIGDHRRYEKNIVLSISHYLATDLKRKGYKVYLSRPRDKFVTLTNRTKFANRKNADIFISIHANSTTKSKANQAYGIETYFLSPARSARAKRVAAIENRGDMNKMGWSSKNSLLTILNQSKITASNKMAVDIQKNMLYYLRIKYGKRAIRDGGVREAPFWVLVGAQMPSILIETGYVSNPQEGRRISTKSYQRLIAKGIAEGVDSYFMKN